MNKDEYFKLSEKRKLPMCCPILDRCSRHAHTVYFFSYYTPGDDGVSVADILKRHGELPPDFDANCVHLRGEMPSFQKSADYVHYCDVCPEVNLFDPHHALPFANGTASTSADWNDTQGVRHSTSRHFSECAEYCAWAATPAQVRAKPSARKAIPQKLRFEILERDHFTCQYCGRSRGKHGVVLHVDHKTSVFDKGSNDLENLTTSCSDCNFGKGKKSIDQLGDEPGAP
jgi:5-methylcytosine-specific restriction endonuclease McrA